VKSTDEITEAVMDTLKEEILVFTPKGDVVSLPKGGLPHTYGDWTSCCGIPLDKQLEMGDRVEIITSKNRSGPSIEWLKIVRSLKIQESCWKNL